MLFPSRQSRRSFLLEKTGSLSSTPTTLAQHGPTVFRSQVSATRCDEDRQDKKALQPFFAVFSKISFENFKIMTAPRELQKEASQSLPRSSEGPEAVEVGSSACCLFAWLCLNAHLFNRKRPVDGTSSPWTKSSRCSICVDERFGRREQPSAELVRHGFPDHFGIKRSKCRVARFDDTARHGSCQTLQLCSRGVQHKKQSRHL